MNMGRVWCVAPIVVAALVFSCGGHAQSSGTSEGRGGSSAEIDKLLKVCDTHLAANRLTAGVGGTAVGCYGEVLSRDPTNLEALEGLRRVFDRYLSWARAALKKGDVDKTRRYVDKLRSLSPEAPEVVALQEQIAKLSMQREDPAEAPAAEKDDAAREPGMPTSSALLAPGRRFRDCPECPEMVVVPPGSFDMGSPASEEGRGSSEGPVHRVAIPAPLAVGRFEVRFAEWDACVESGGCNGYLPDDNGRGRDRRPVINVGWKDARSYVRWLSRKTGKHYRLLSEAEWEYAARAGSRTSRHWGDRVSAQCKFANGRDKSSERFLSTWTGANCRDRFVFSAPAGKYKPNEFGLFDMLGNVWEWVEDCWHGSYAGAPVDGSAWATGGGCGRRVVRGGSYGSQPEKLRSAHRSRTKNSERKANVGFRVVRSLVP